MTEISRRFARLVIAAVEHPVAVNPNAVLDAASGFLDAAPAGMARPPDSVARTMAQRAVDYCIWPDCHTVLVRAVDAFCIWCKIDSAINKPRLPGLQRTIFVQVIGHRPRSA
jgi:hypothetical protein